MTDNEKLFAITGRLHVVLRREQARIIDVEWIKINGDYTREVLRLARASGSQELEELSLQVETLHPLLKDSSPRAVAEKSRPSVPMSNDSPLGKTSESSKYTFTLR